MTTTGKKPRSPTLIDQLKATGGIIDTSGPRGRGRPRFRTFGDVLASAGGKLAEQVFREHLRLSLSQGRATQSQAERNVARRTKKSIYAVKQAVKRHQEFKIVARLNYHLELLRPDIVEFELYILAMPEDLQEWAKSLRGWQELLSYFRASGITPGTCPASLIATLRRLKSGS